MGGPWLNPTLIGFTAKHVSEHVLYGVRAKPPGLRLLPSPVALYRIRSWNGDAIKGDIHITFKNKDMETKRQKSELITVGRVATCCGSGQEIRLRSRGSHDWPKDQKTELVFNNDKNQFY